jgi:hypothetical protein
VVRHVTDMGQLEGRASVRIEVITEVLKLREGTRWRSSLRYCATSREVRAVYSRWSHWNFSST